MKKLPSLLSVVFFLMLSVSHVWALPMCATKKEIKCGRKPNSSSYYKTVMVCLKNL